MSASAPDAMTGVAAPGPATMLRARLADGVKTLGLRLDPAQLDRLIAYLQLLERWNRVYNLTSVRDPVDMVSVHLLDSLAIADLVRTAPAGRVLDVGTGPGLPGIPLAIALPQRHFDLVDAVAKKVGFLQQVKASLSLDNITPHHARVEVLTLAELPTVIVSRAYSDLSTMLRSIDAVAPAHATVIAMKGALPTDEIAAMPDDWRVVEVRPLDVPMLGAQRCALILRRVVPPAP